MTTSTTTDTSTAPAPEVRAPEKATEKPARSRRQDLKARLDQLTPILVTGALLIAIAEIMLFGALPTSWAVVINVTVVALVVLVWLAVRRRKAKRRKTAGDRRPWDARAAGLLGMLGGILGRRAGGQGGAGRGSGRQGGGLFGGSRNRGGLLGKLTGGRFGSKPKGGAGSGSTGRPSRNPFSKASRQARKERRSAGGSSWNPLSRAGRQARKDARSKGAGSTSSGGSGSTSWNPFSRTNRQARKDRRQDRKANRADKDTGAAGSKSKSSTPRRVRAAAAWKSFADAVKEGYRGKPEMAQEKKETKPDADPEKTGEEKKAEPAEQNTPAQRKPGTKKSEPVKVPARPHSPRHAGAPEKGPAMHAFEDRSLYGFGESLKQVPTTIEEMRVQYEAMACAAEEDQPIGSAVSEGLRGIAELLRAAEDIAADLHPSFRRENEADIERYENPRKGNIAVESRADVQSAQRDV